MLITVWRQILITCFELQERPSQRTPAPWCPRQGRWHRRVLACSLGTSCLPPDHSCSQMYLSLTHHSVVGPQPWWHCWLPQALRPLSDAASASDKIETRCIYLLVCLCRRMRNSLFCSVSQHWRCNRAMGFLWTMSLSLTLATAMVWIFTEK